ncbi:MAG: hypothetical protein JNK47_02890 [Mesorhizobium sp.]|nr:hypothetical protein [Mesorhizobium sp.]MBL8576147.1 hypothetical protein [Mesorhizobium sp.]
MTDKAVSAFSARLAYWTSQGLSGSQLYEALASDSELPAVFEPNEIAAIQGIKPQSVKRDRMRGGGPNYIRVTERQIRYPRDEFCKYLAAKFVRREAA